jgi:hypothetical protein
MGRRRRNGNSSPFDPWRHDWSARLLSKWLTGLPPPTMYVNYLTRLRNAGDENGV